MVFNNFGRTGPVCGPQGKTGWGWGHESRLRTTEAGGLRKGLGGWPARASPDSLGRSRLGVEARAALGWHERRQEN